MLSKKIQVKLHNQDTTYTPSKVRKSDGGYDLKACIEYTSEEDITNLLHIQNYIYSEFRRNIKIVVDGRFIGDTNSLDSTALDYLKNIPFILLNSAKFDFIDSPSMRMISSGVRLNIPETLYHEDLLPIIMILPRSGLACKHQISIINSPGLIDQEYTGDISVGLENRGSSIHFFTNGARIAQMVILECIQMGLQLDEYIKEIPKSSRGEQGFGSSGVK